MTDDEYSRPEVRQALGDLREYVGRLTAQIDAGLRPPPTKYTSDMPGPVWRPGDGWAVWSFADGAVPPAIYLGVPYENGDLEAVRTTTARRLAAAILAACDWADERAAGVPRINSQ